MQVNPLRITKQWELYDTVAGGAEVTIPADVEEVIVELSASSISFNCYLSTIQSSNTFRYGYYANNSNYANAYVTWNFTTRKVASGGISYAGTAQTTTVRVYVR